MVTRRGQPAMQVPQMPLLSVLPRGQMKDVAVIKAKDQWSEFKLSDGTVLLAKPAIVDVRRVIGQYTPDGDPLYLTSIAMVMRTRAPKALMKKLSGKK